MKLLIELKNLENKRNELQEKLEKQKLKVGDEVHFLYYKPFIGYKITRAKIIDTNVSIYDDGYAYEIKLKTVKQGQLIIKMCS